MAESHTQTQTPAPENFVLHEDLIGFVIHALSEGDTRRVRDLVKGLHQGDISELLHLLSPDDRKRFVDSIRETLDPELLVWLDGEVREEVIAHLGAEESAAAIGQLDHDDALQVMEYLDDEEKSQILDAVPDKALRQELEQGLSLPEDAAGRIMDTCFVAVPVEWSVGQVIDYLRGESDDDLPDDFYSIYLLDKDKNPVSSVLVSRVMRNRREVKLTDIMEEKLYKVNTTTDQEEVAYLFSKYALVSVPVVNEKGAIAGVIAIDDVMDVIEEEAEEDILSLAGVGDTDLYASLGDTVKNRLPWLLINLVAAVLASQVIAEFQGSIEQLVTLAVLMPIVASMAGNAGMQTLTVAVRGLAMKELTAANAKRIVRKELLTGCLNGLLLGLVLTIAAWLLYDNAGLAAVFGLAVLTVLAIANFSGVVIPLILTKLRIDPAVSSAVFLTTVTDISGFFVFLGLASWWLL